MKKIGFLFPGQSSHYIGMGKDLYEEFAVGKETFEEANETLGFDLKSLCFFGDIDELTATVNAQPAILTVSVAAFRVLMQELKLVPTFVAGHSLGEFTALTCTGALSFADALKIVRQRGTLMQEAVPTHTGAMLAVIGMQEWDVESLCQEVSSIESKVVIANYNSPDQIVISGHVEAVQKAKEKANERGAKTIPLNVSAPFHSHLMTSAASDFRDELERYTYGEFQWPVISNVTATPYSDKRFIVQNLTEQIDQPVQWNKSIQYMRNKGIETFVEIGPKKVLKNLLSNVINTGQTFSFEHPSDLDVLRKADIESKPDGLGLIKSCIAIAVSTQNHNWNNEEYEKGVVIPYQKLEQMRDHLIETNTEPTKEQMKMALDLLTLIFETKLTPDEIQKERFNQIRTDTHTHELFSELEHVNV